MTPADLATARSDESALRAMLTRAGVVTWKGRACCCPFHGDKHPSAGIFVGDDGAWRFKCQVCGVTGDVFDIQARIEGKPLAEVLKTDLPKTKARAFFQPSGSFGQSEPDPTFTIDELRAKYKPQAEHLYTNPGTGKADMMVLRIPDPKGKTFRQCSPVGDRWKLSAPEKPWPLYNRGRIRRCAKIIVVEGEKCVEALHMPANGCEISRAGIAATTSPGGAQNAKNADWTPLAGKEVWLWPDNDEPGKAYMRDVAVMLAPLGCTVHTIDPESTGLGEKGDAADFVQSLSDTTPEDCRAAILDLLGDADDLTGAGKLGKRFRDIKEGRWSDIHYPWPMISKYTRANLPGKMTVVCGPPGSTKSFMVLEACLYWHKQGRKVALYELEDDAEDHLQRLIAILAGNASMLSPEWIAHHHELVEETRAKFASLLDSFDRCMTVLPDGNPSLDDLADWVNDRAKDGCEIIAIDPITAADAGRDRFVADQRFVLRVKQIIRPTGARLILVTHPKQITQAKGMDAMSGGAAYQRFPHTLLWVDSMEKTESVRVGTPAGPSMADINRKLSIHKARNSTGKGMVIGMHFDPATLRFGECGVILKDDE